MNWNEYKLRSMWVSYFIIIYHKYKNIWHWIEYIIDINKYYYHWYIYIISEISNDYIIFENEYIISENIQIIKNEYIVSDIIQIIENEYIIIENNHIYWK